MEDPNSVHRLVRHPRGTELDVKRYVTYREATTEMCSETRLGSTPAQEYIASARCIVRLVIVIVSVSRWMCTAIKNMIIWSYDHMHP